MTTDSHFVSRRIFLAGSLASTVAAGPIQAQEAPDPMCPRCGGVGRVPAGDAKPFVWLRGTPLPKWEEKTAALSERIARARLEAARRLEPQAIRVQLPSRTLRTTDEVDGYLSEARGLILLQIDAGHPVVV